MNALTREWVEKAEEDYLGAVALRRQHKKPLPDLVCFHCQQSAEKYLKALLQEHGVKIPKTHELIALLDLTRVVDRSLVDSVDDCTTLSDYAVDFRYPGRKTTNKDALEAIAAAQRIRARLRKCLGLRAPPSRKSR